MYLSFHRGLFTLVFSAIFLVAGAYSNGQEKTEGGGVASGGSLQVGDSAPKLSVDHWLGGSPVESFSKDNVYVVEFWATWCGPCIKSMPHLSELADRYASQGLVVIAMTKADEANTREAVEEFIGGPGKDYRFRFAMCDGEATYDSYMVASGQKGIPCSFVIDREGKVAYIGHPHDLDYVLERVIAGKWRGKEDADEIREMNESIAKLGELAQKDPQKALEIVAHIRRVNPQRAKSIDFAYVEMLTLCQLKMFDRAKETIELATDGAEKSVEWGGVAMLCGLLASEGLNPEGQHREFAKAKMEAAEEALKDDWQNLMQVGVAYQLSGDKAKFKECMDRAIELCPDEQMKKSLRFAIEMQMKAIGE